MVTFLFIVGVVVFGVKFPRAADAAAWLLTLFFIAPVMLVATGTVVHIISSVAGWGWTPSTCYWGFGGAAALMVSTFVLKD